MRTNEAVAKVDHARAALAKAEADLRTVRSRRQILCSCGTRHAINKLELLVTHWYHEPHGCTGGDYWSEGEWQFVCPADGTRNRLLFDGFAVEYEDRGRIGICAEATFKSIYRGLFASSRDTHRDEGSSPWFNNYYVDKHREQFELPVRAGVKK